MKEAKKVDQNYRNLMFAVIKRAVLDCKNNLYAIENNEIEKAKKEATAWIKSEECKYFCKVTDFDYKLIKKNLNLS